MTLTTIDQQTNRVQDEKSTYVRSRILLLLHTAAAGEVTTTTDSFMHVWIERPANISFFFFFFSLSFVQKLKDGVDLI